MNEAANCLLQNSHSFIPTSLLSPYPLFSDKGPARSNCLSNAPTAGTPRSVVHTVISKKIAPFDRLTERERDVCERILLGYTSIGIGLDLNIAPSSVVTYRRRAYEKLGIATQNELFALCLGASRSLPR